MKRRLPICLALTLAVVALPFVIVMLATACAPSEPVDEPPSTDFTVIPIGKVYLSDVGVVRLFWVCEVGSCHKCVGWLRGYGGGLSCAFDYATDEEVILSLFE